MWYQLVESVVVTTIALIIAFALTERMLPILNGVLGKTMELNYFSLEFLFFVPLLGLVIGVLTGLYPSFYISRYKPLVLLKSNANGVSGKGRHQKVSDRVSVFGGWNHDFGYACYALSNEVFGAKENGLQQGTAHLYSTL